MKACNEFYDFTAFYGNNTKPLKVCYDIGSRDCGEALAFYNTYGSKVYAFEPNPFQKQVCLNNIKNTSVTLFDVALSNIEGELDFYITHDNVGASSLLRPQEVPHTGGAYNVSKITVPTVTLDNFVATHSLPLPDLIWMDVQGNELNVLKGAVNTLKYTSYICSEVGVVPYYDNHTLEPDINLFLHNLGFEIGFEKLEWAKEKFVIYKKIGL